MAEEILIHTGVLGMKWRIHRTKQSKISKPKGTLTKETAKPIIQPEKKSVKQMSDTEMRERINRLQMERQYKDLIKADKQAEVSKGKAFVTSILEASGKNIATQLATYVLGQAVNKAAGAEVVNPKKGQKDK